MNTDNRADELKRAISVFLEDVNDLRVLEVIKWMLLTNQEEISYDVKRNA